MDRGRLRSLLNQNLPRCVQESFKSSWVAYLPPWEFSIKKKNTQIKIFKCTLLKELKRDYPPSHSAGTPSKAQFALGFNCWPNPWPYRRVVAFAAPGERRAVAGGLRQVGRRWATRGQTGKGWPRTNIQIRSPVLYFFIFFNFLKNIFYFVLIHLTQ